MSNPVFNNSAVFGEPKNRRGGAATQAAPAYGARPRRARARVRHAPAGRAVGCLRRPDRGRGAARRDVQRTVGDHGGHQAPHVRRRDHEDGGLLALLVVVGAASWYLTPQMPFLYLLGAVAGLVLGLVNAFKRNPSPALIIAYTVAQGLFLGGISLAFGTMTVGNGGNLTDIVFQAVLATVATFAAALFLFRSGKVRVTPKFTRWLLIAMVGYLAFSLVNVVLVLFGVLDGWGMRGGTIGIVVGLIAVGLAAASLIVDFDSIKRGVEAGVPAKFAWSAAFGLMVTLIWLYLEFLRLFAILQSSD